LSVGSKHLKSNDSHEQKEEHRYMFEIEAWHQKNILVYVIYHVKLDFFFAKSYKSQNLRSNSWYYLGMLDIF